MKKTLVIILFFFISSVYLHSQEVKVNPITKIIEETRSQYAPDKRLAIFNVSAIDGANITILTGETNIPEAKQDLTNKLKKLNLNFTDEIHSLPESKLVVANIRTYPDHPAELATQALLGTPVKIYKYLSGFYLVQTPDNYIAWVDDDGILPMNKAQLNEWLKSEKIIFTKEYDFSFSEPTVTSSHISDLTAGDILVNLAISLNLKLSVGESKNNLNNLYLLYLFNICYNIITIVYKSFFFRSDQGST